MSRFVWSSGEPQSIEIDGRRLEAICHGPAPQSAATIVLLHEGLGSVGLWRDFPRKLVEATGLGVFAWSRAGYGKSDPVALPRPLDYMTREAEGVVGKVLDAAGVERAVLLGHSDGASIAAIYAGGVSDRRVRALVLLAPHFFTEPEGLAAIGKAKRDYEEADLRRKLAKHHDDVEVAFRGWCDAWLDPGFKSWNIADCLDYLRVPALVVQGGDDAYGTARQVEEIAARSYAPVEVEMIPGCGHAPHHEAAERTLGRIAAFCSRWERIEAA